MAGCLCDRASAFRLILELTRKRGGPGAGAAALRISSVKDDDMADWKFTENGERGASVASVGADESSESTSPELDGAKGEMHWKACSRCICRRTRQICCCRYMEDMLSRLPLYSDAAISVSWRAHARRVIHCAHEGHPRMLRCRPFMPTALAPSQFSLVGGGSICLLHPASHHSSPVSRRREGSEERQ